MAPGQILQDKRSLTGAKKVSCQGPSENNPTCWQLEIQASGRAAVQHMVAALFLVPSGFAGYGSRAAAASCRPWSSAGAPASLETWSKAAIGHDV